MVADNTNKKQKEVNNIQQAKDNLVFNLAAYNTLKENKELAAGQLMNLKEAFKDADKIIQEVYTTKKIKLERALTSAKDKIDLKAFDLETEERELKKLIEEAETAINLEEFKSYRTEHNNYIEQFFNDIETNNLEKAITTGFNKLDEELDGGLYQGLYIIGALSSLGKTTFALQLADQAAEKGTDVLIFSLEMARNELIAKSISRLTAIADFKNAKTTRAIYNRLNIYQNDMQDKNKEILKAAREHYQLYAKNLFIIEGTGQIGIKQIRENIERHIKITGKKPLIIIDYLQIIPPENEKLTDKQSIDKTVSELKRISRDNKLTIMAISSVNRQSYNKPISMEAFKESGAIEYSSDVLIGLQFKGLDKIKGAANNQTAAETFISEQRQSEKREIELAILKNRNGKTGGRISYNYYTKFNLLKEEQ